MVRIHPKLRSTLIVVVPAAVLAVGIFVGPLRSAEWNWRSPILAEVGELTELEPVRALPRTEAVLATLEAQRYLEAGRPYAAWRRLERHLDVEGTAGAAAGLLAARAAIEWEGWREVRRALADQPWLVSAQGGDGLLLLARAEAELGNPGTAAGLLTRYVDLPSAARKGEAYARLGDALARQAKHGEAASAYQAAAANLPAAADWLRVRQVEQLVEAGDPDATTVATAMTGGTPPVRTRRVQLEAQAWITAAETNRAISRLDWEARVLNASGARAEAGRLHLERAKLMVGSTSPQDGRLLLAALASDATFPAQLRGEAADILGDLSDRSAVEEMAVAAGHEAAGEPGLAARALRSAFEKGAAAEPLQRLRLGNLLYAERDYGPARAAYEQAAQVLTDPERKAEAELQAARSLYRAGGSSRVRASNRQRAIGEFRSVADRYEGTAAAGTALFLLGDESSTLSTGRDYYRRAAAVTSSPDAREALYRAGDRSLRLDDTAGAIRAWEQYVARYPQGGETARIAYEVGKLHERAGRRSEMRAMYTAAIAAEPTSYWAVRAAERLGVHPLDAVLAEPRPWVGLASEPADALAVLERMDLLRSLGLHEEADAEYDWALRRLEDKPAALIVLAEGMRDRNEPIEAIRLGRSLLGQRNQVWDDRLLRVVFPFLYRDVLVAEARRARIDPILYAGLVRQESSFRHDARSWVGATGLGQIMPATGRWLAPRADIDDFDVALLEVPELNLRMGTAYFGDLMRRYDGAADLALAGYNAGPGRADRWRSTLNHGGDTDAFRAAIPFDETRNYVMLVLRNAAIYDRLYGEEIAD